jgi:hypothetical protein
LIVYSQVKKPNHQLKPIDDYISQKKFIMQASIEGTKNVGSTPTLTILEALPVSTILGLFGTFRDLLGLFKTNDKANSKPE